MELEKPFSVSCKLSKELYQLKWTIEGFNLIPFVRDHPLFGPSIRLGKHVDSTWQLLMAKQRGVEDKIPSLGFKLVKTEDNTVWDVCRYDVSVFDESGKVCLSVVENALAGGDEDLPYVFAKGVSEGVYVNEDGNPQPDDDSPVKAKRKVQSQMNASTLQDLFKERVVKVVCDIRYVYMTDSDDEPAQVLEDQRLVQDLKGLLKNPKFSDVVLCAGDKEFPAHRNVLSSRAVGLDFELYDGRDQLVRQKVNLDMSASTAEFMLLYVYSGDFPKEIGAGECYDLYKVSKRFGISHLEELCKNTLREMAKEEPSCNDCASEEAAFEILVDSDKGYVCNQIAKQIVEDAADAIEAAEAALEVTSSHSEFPKPGDENEYMIFRKEEIKKKIEE